VSWVNDLQSIELESSQYLTDSSELRGQKQQSIGIARALAVSSSFATKHASY
jgi:ABC-type oligopeptide transport system ATPase subunit